MDELVILYTTWPDAETAEAFGRRAVEEKLAACANVLAPMRSIYQWDGQLQVESETAMLLKTTTACAERLGQLILKYSPYETPCIVALLTEPRFCNPAYTSWARSQTSEQP